MFQNATVFMFTHLLLVDFLQRKKTLNKKYHVLHGSEMSVNFDCKCCLHLLIGPDIQRMKNVLKKSVPLIEVWLSRDHDK